MACNRRFVLAPPFTGSRTYLHGVDIFDGILHRMGAITDIKLTLTAASDCAIEVADDDGTPGASPEVCGSVVYLVDGDRRRLRLVRRRDIPIRERLPLDENALIAGAVISGDVARIPAGEATFMRRVAAAGIHLLGLRCPGDYWAIAEVACTRVPPNNVPALVTLTRLLGGRYWRATASATEGGAVGTILLARGGPRR